MKTPQIQNRKTPAFALAAILSLTLGFQAPAESVRYEAQPAGSKCKMLGTSSMGHDWTMESVMVTGFMEVDANFPESALTNAAAANPVTQVAIPVRTFKSGKAAMDTKMQNHMNITKFPKIEYRLIELKPKSPASTTGALQFDAVGALTIVGTTLTNTMPVTIAKSDGKLKVSGSCPIKFGSYGLKPPVFSILGFDAITVGEDLKITFEWALAPKAK
jgi:polyisoprenoid-binding protein YceI